jgi:hypothetical protein
MHTYITDHECAEVSTIEFFIKKETIVLPYVVKIH